MNDQQPVSGTDDDFDGPQMRWLSKPSAADMAIYVPERAERQSISGKAVLKCGIAVDGRLERCRVISETPRDFGFGEAALRLAPKFQTDPPSPGKDSAATVTLPISWRLGKPYRPDWQRKPTADEMAEYYPAKARRMDLGGHARLTCKVMAEGKLQRCVATDEAPVGMGFGEAALKLSSVFRMTPPPPGLEGVKEVTIPITFAVPPTTPFMESLFGKDWRAQAERAGALAISSILLVVIVVGVIYALRKDQRVDL